MGGYFIRRDLVMYVLNVILLGLINENEMEKNIQNFDPATLSEIQNI
jgi:hypothetical protein